MGRSGYTEDFDHECVVQYINWRGCVASASRGKRGQAFFRALVRALDAMPIKRLIANKIEQEGEVCAFGALARAQGKDVNGLDSEDHPNLAHVFDIAHQLAAETMYQNDEAGRGSETPEERWLRVREWAADNIIVREDELLPLPENVEE